jgi:hypothetical protein
MATGLMVAAAFAVASAIDAYRGARRPVIRESSPTTQHPVSSVTLEPPTVRGSAHRLEIDLVRIRF